MNKLAIFAVAMAAGIASNAVANEVNGVGVPYNTDGLYVLATTGWADDRASEGYGIAYDKTGGKPGAFTYMDSDMMVPGYDAAVKLLAKGEFLAPHYIDNWDGSIDIMVAPHLLADGEVMHGANVFKNHIIRVMADGSAQRFEVEDGGKVVPVIVS